MALAAPTTFRDVYKRQDRLNAFRVEPFKDSLRKDAKAILASYLSRKRSGQTVSYPKVYVDHYQCNKSMQKLIDSLQECEISKTQFLRKMAKILEKYRKPKTIFFCRNAKNRDFSLLYQPGSGRYYAKIYLMNYADAIANPTLDEKGEYGSLVYVSPEKEPFGNSLSLIHISNVRQYVLPVPSW